MTIPILWTTFAESWDHRTGVSGPPYRSLGTTVPESLDHRTGVLGPFESIIYLASFGSEINSDAGKETYG